MEKQNIYLIALATLLLITVVSLAALNEARLDVYVSIFTVAYFATSAILSPRRRIRDFLAAALFLVFSLIVVFRVLEMLIG